MVVVFLVDVCKKKPNKKTKQPQTNNCIAYSNAEGSGFIGKN